MRVFAVAQRLDQFSTEGAIVRRVIVQGGSPDKPGLMLGASLAALH